VYKLLPVEKCAFFKDILPGLSWSWNLKKKSRTLQEAWEPWPAWLGGISIGC